MLKHKLLYSILFALFLTPFTLATECNQLAEDVVRLSQRAQSLQKDMANFCSSLDEKSRLDFSDEEFLKRWSFAFILLRTELAACATVAQHERKTSEAIDKSLYDAVTAACLIERFNTSVFLRSTAGKHRLVRNKLNEELPEYAIPNDLYDNTTAELRDGRLKKLVKECHLYLSPKDNNRTMFTDAGIPKSLFNSCDRSYNNITREAPTLLRAKVGGVFSKVGKTANGLWYKLVESIAMAVRRRTKDIPYAVPTSGLVEKLKKQLLPGDIIITRKNWVMSNMFLPGFFKHGILYVGTSQNVIKKQLWDDPEVARCLREHSSPCADGNERRIIEGIGEGVSIRSLEAGCQADYVVVFRPRLKDQDIDTAIKRAFAQLGKPYDFSFSFATEDKLVCTELIYRCYRDLLNFKLEKIKGSQRLPANAIIRKWRDERGTIEQELDLVAFIDKDLTTNKCHFGTAEDLIEALDRPGRDGALHKEWTKEHKPDESFARLTRR